MNQQKRTCLVVANIVQYKLVKTYTKRASARNPGPDNLSVDIGSFIPGDIPDVLRPYLGPFSLLLFTGGPRPLDLIGR